ncbi:MAG: hypothetical protein Q4A34_01325 [Candidatus Saccharibacteria bacterium]|nr:hypothetical protein [Candidatus Saccharibacteria bacterium]
MAEVEYKQVDGPVTLSPQGIRKVGFTTDTGVLYLAEIATLPLIPLEGGLQGAFLNRLVSFKQKGRHRVIHSGVITNITITVGEKVSVMTEYSADELPQEADASPETPLGKVVRVYLPKEGGGDTSASETS